jgi:hypothetical protein
VFGVHGIVGMGNVFVRLLFRRAFLIVVDLDGRGRFERFRCGRGNGFLDGGYDWIRLSSRRSGLVGSMRVLIMGMFVIMMVVAFMIVVMMIVIVAVIMIVRLVLMVIAMMLVRVRLVVGLLGVGRLSLLRFEQGGVGTGALDDLTADAVAMATAPRIAVA